MSHARQGGRPCIPFGGHPSRGAYATARRNEGAKLREIAQEMRVSINAVHKMLNPDRVNRRLTGIRLQERDLQRLEAAAARRDVPVPVFAARLLKAVLRRGLVKAVLDDGVHNEPTGENAGEDDA